MSNSRPTSPSPRPRPSSQTIPRSRSRPLTPRHEYTPSPPRRFSAKPTSALTPPSRKRYRSPSPRNSPRNSPPRKNFRQTRNTSRSPSPSRRPCQSRPSYRSYRSPSPRNRRSPRTRHSPRTRRSPDHRYPSRPYHYNRSISPSRHRSPPRNIPRSPPRNIPRSPPIRSSPNRHSPSRRRYYSPPPRPFPPRYARDYSPQSRRSRDPETRYPPSDSHRPSLPPSRPSRSRSPRSRRDRRRRDKRRRQREPLSPSKRIPDDQVQQLFLDALKLVLKYRRPPFNISVVSDYMTSIDRNWSIRKTQYPTFSDLCRLQESRDHLRLARHGESVVINSSKYQPDTLEPKPRDFGRKKAQRDRERVNHGDKLDDVDPIRRRDWDLEERALARKERFREDKDVSRSNTDVPARSRQTSLDHFEEDAIVTRESNERNISRGSRDDGSGTTTPNGVEASETNPATRSVHCASPPHDSSRIPNEKPFDIDSTLEAETSPHCSSAPKSGSKHSTTEGDEKVESLS